MARRQSLIAAVHAHRKTILVSGTLALVVGGVILLARQGLGMASLWATVLGLPISIIGGITAVWTLILTVRGTPQPIADGQRTPVLADLLMTTVADNGLPPVVTAVDLYGDLGVSPSIPVKAGAPDHYIKRDQDGAIRQALTTSRFVIVKGAPKAGKSRSAFEAVRATYPEALLVAPWPRKNAMSQIAENNLLNGYSGRVIFWLDDLADFLTTELDRAIVLKLFRLYPQALLVGTILAADLSARKNAPAPSSAIPDLLQLAADGEVRLPSSPTPGELARARELYPGQEFSDDVGIAEQLVAADLLTGYFEDAGNDVGWCLVMAGVDWLRTGATSPVPRTVLRNLAVNYCDLRRANLRMGDQEIDAGFEWAEHTFGSSEALLNVVEREADGNPRAYQAFGPLRTLVDTPVPSSTWRTAASIAPPADLIPVALGALAVGPGLRDVAKGALSTACDSADRHAADWAALLLGDLQAQDGQVDTARRLYDRATTAADDTVSGLAGVELGALVMNLGELDESRRLLEAAVSSANPPTVPLAKAMLGSLLIATGEPDQAARFLHEAIASQNPLAVSLAQAMLGALLINTGQLDQAREQLTAAIDSGNPLAMPLAQASLGTLLMSTGELREAERLLREAMGSGIPQAIILAQSAMSGLLTITGHPDQARQILEDAVANGNPLVVPLAQANLGEMLARAGETDRAKDLLDAAVRSRHPVASALARVYQGELLALTDQPDAARDVLESVIQSRNPLVVPLAQVMLGTITEDLDTARTLLLAAASSGNPAVKPLAEATLGARLLDAGDLEQARPLLESAAASSASPVAPGLAQLSLGDLYARIEQPDLARRALQAAAHSLNPDVVPRARYLLAGQLDDEQDWPAAQAAYQTVIAAGDEPYTSLARIDLAFMRQQRGAAAELLAPPHPVPPVVIQPSGIGALDADTTAGLAAWIEEWAQAAAGAREGFPDSAGLTIPLGSLLVVDRLATAQRALDQRAWHLARPVLRAVAAGLRVADHQAPAPTVRAGLHLLLARIALALGEDPSDELAAAQTMGAGPAGLAVVQAWAARQHNQPGEAADHLAHARASATADPAGPSVLAEILTESVAQARSISTARDELAALAALGQIPDLPAELLRLVQPVPAELWLAIAERAAAPPDAQAVEAALDRAERAAGSDEQLRASIREQRAELLAASQADPAARADALVAAGEPLLDAGLRDAAARHFQDALALWPGDTRAALDLVIARMPASFPDQPDAESVRVVTEAIASTQTIHAEHDVDAESLLWSLSNLVFWQLYLAQAEIPGSGWRAMRAAGRALAIRADQAHGWVSLSEAAGNLGFYQCAAFAARHARTLDPGSQPDDEVLQALISTAANVGDLDTMRTALPADAAQGQPWFQAVSGYILWRSGHGPEAIALLRAAVTADPAQVWARVELLQYLLLAGHGDLARSEAAQLTAQLDGRQDRAATQALAWSALVSGDFAAAERLGSELTRFENDSCDDGQGLQLTGMAKLLAGRDGLDDLAASAARSRTAQSLDNWHQFARPILEELAREHGTELPDLARQDEVVAGCRPALAARSDPVTELAEASPGTADPEDLAQVLALLGVLLREAEPDLSAARAALQTGAATGHAVPEWPELASRVRQAYVADCLTRGELDAAASAEEERLTAAAPPGAVGRLPEIALLMDAAGRHDDAQQVLGTAKRLAGDLPELTRATGDVLWRGGERAGAAQAWEAARVAGDSRSDVRLAVYAAVKPDVPAAAAGFRAAILRSCTDAVADLRALPLEPADMAAAVAALEEVARDPDTAPGAWLAIAVLARPDYVELPAPRLKVLYSSSFLAGIPDAESGGPLVSQYLPEARLRLPWPLPGVNLTLITDFEPGTYRILVLGTVFEQGTIEGTSYVPADAIPLLSSALRARVTDTRLMDLILLREGEPAVSGTDSLLLVSAAEVLARRVQAVATRFRTSVE
jgi:Tfp pilus assembly protein PilF